MLMLTLISSEKNQQVTSISAQSPDLKNIVEKTL